MGKLNDLTGVFMLGTAASIGAVFSGASEIGVTGTLVFGWLTYLGIQDEEPLPERPVVEPEPSTQRPPAPPAPTQVTGEARAVANQHWANIDRAEFRSEARRFLKQRRNLTIRRKLLSDFRYALAQARHEALVAGECLTISQWFLKGRAELKRHEKLP